VRRLLPWLTLAQILGILAADAGALRTDAAAVLACSAAALGVVLPWGARGRAALALLLAFAAGGGAMARGLDAGRRGVEAAPRIFDVEARVAAVAAGGPSWRVDLVELRGLGGGPPPPPRVRVYGRPTPSDWAGLERAQPGDRIRARLRLVAAGGLRNPGAPDRERALRRAGIGAVGRLVHPGLHVRLATQSAPAGRGAWPRLRARAGRGLEESGPGGGLLLALALGDRSRLDLPVREAFAELGVAHLLAVSGLHLALVAGLFYAVAARTSGRLAALTARWDVRRPALALAVLAAGAYGLLAGWGVPVRRAWLLLLAAALRFTGARPGPRLEPLALAASAILALEPHALFAPGAQLSFAAAAALSLSPAPAMPSPGGARGALRGLLWASSTAVAVTAPLAAWRLGSRAPLALLVNLVAVPWTGLVLLPLALAASAAALLQDLPGAGTCLGVAERAAAITTASAGWAAARLPGSAAAPAPAGPWLCLAALLGLASVAVRRVERRVVLAGAVTGLVALAPPPARLPPPPRVVFLDVGQGDASLVQGREAALLVDAARALPGGIDLGRSAVVPALRALNVKRLDLAVATHADLDHRGGLPAVIEAIPVDELWLPRGARREPGFDALRARARRRGVRVRERGAGDAPLRVGDLVVVPLWPPSGSHGLGSNDRSLVLRVSLGPWRLLLAGDIEQRAEAALVASGADLRAHVLALPHHGSRSSSSRQLLEAVGPHLGVASAPCRGRFGMPHPEVRARLRRVGAALWWTGRDGAVRVGLGPRLHAFGSGEPRRCGVGGTGSAAGPGR
jgi:competence protein ComEC